MQAIVERVKRALTFKRQVPDAEGKRVQHEVTAFAAELLENLQRQLAGRTIDTGRH